MNFIINRIKSPFVFIMMATLICGFWGLYAQAPGLIKIVFSGLVLISMVVFPYKKLFVNDYDFFEKILLIGLFFLGGGALVRSCLNNNPDMYAFGNKWVTLFANEYCLPLFFPPLFACLANDDTCFKLLNKKILSFSTIALLYCLRGNVFLIPFMLFVIPPYFIYSLNQHKRIFFLVIIASVIGAFWGARSFLLFVAVALLAIFPPMLKKNSILPKVVVLVMLLIPLVMFMPLLIGSVVESNFFQQVLLMFAKSGFMEGGGVDTRTFLYLEMMEDLNRTSSLMFGKGAYAHYYSFYFDNLKEFQNTSFGRMACEVPLLNFLLHGGIVYCVFYFGLILLAIRKAFVYGKNKFVRSIAILAAGWVSISFVGDIIGCRFYHIVFFCLIGCCFSRTILYMSDEEIKQRLNQ